MTISQSGIEFIMQYEGLSETPYKCTAGTWTIGFGHTGPDTSKEGYYDGNRLYARITTEQAMELLLSDVQTFAQGVDYATRGVHLEQYQFDALCSFAYNVGLASFRKSSLLKKLLINPNASYIEDEFLKWVFAGKENILDPDTGNVVGSKAKHSRGLQVRRQAEAKLYFNRSSL